MDQGTIASTLKSAVRQKNIPGLDAMRAAAIILVILFHFKAPIAGALGVIIFFVLSGFLITGILLKEIARSNTISIRNFYKRRAYRIFPAFYVCWFVTMGVMAWQHIHVSRFNALTTFFYAADYARAALPLKQQYVYQMGITWSLAVEEQFYLLWPLVLLWLYRKSDKQAQAVAWIIWGLWAWRAVLVIGLNVSWDYAYNAFDTRADAMMIGCWLAIILHRKRRVPQAILWWISNKWLTLIPLTALTLLNVLDVRGLLSAAEQVVEFTLDPILVAILLLQWIYWGSDGWIMLEHPTIKFVARISYSLYLYHQVMHTVFGEMLRFIPMPHGGSALNIALSFLVATASYYGIERPFMRMRDRGKRSSVLLDDGLAHES